MEDPRRIEILNIMARCSGGDQDLLREWKDSFERGLLPYNGEWLPAEKVRSLRGRRRASRVGLVEVWVFFAVVVLIELIMLLVVRGLHR